jgi:hypothetical protein
MPRHRPERSPERSPASRPAAAPAPRGAGLFPSLADLLDPRGPFLLPLVLLLASRLVMALGNPAPAEDAFITFRYARNLASGNGLVYNPGEHVMGFTSPLWTVWTALGVALVRNPIPWALGWSLIADLVTLLAGGRLVAAVGGRAAAWTFALAFAVWPYWSGLAASGMEMSVCAALLVMAAALVHRRSRLAGPALAALVLTRPEGLAAALVLSLAATWRDRVAGAALAGAGLVALALRFGSPIPNSLTAKADVYGVPGPWAGRHWWEWISPVVMGRFPPFGDTSTLIMLAVVTAPAAVMGGVELWRRRDTPLARLVAALLVIWITYAALGVAYFWWYLVFPLLAATLLVAVGLPRVVRGPAVPVALALFVASIWTVALSLYRGRSFTEATSFGLMAGELRGRAAPGDAVLLEPIGMIGYACPVVVIDETGLVTPEVARRRLQGAGWYTDVVARRQPRWLIVRRGVLESQQAFAGAGRPFRDAPERDSLLARYAAVTTTGDPASENALVLMQRR